MDIASNKIAKVTLDTSLDDIEDLPSYLQPPTGGYKVVLVNGIEEKRFEATKDKEAVDLFQMDFKIEEVLEFNEKELDAEMGEEPPKPGDIFSQSFDRTNVIAMGAFKALAKPIRERFGISSVGELVGVSKGLSAVILVTRTWNDTKKRYFSRIRRMELI